MGFIYPGVACAFGSFPEMHDSKFSKAAGVFFTREGTLGLVKRDDGDEQVLSRPADGASVAGVLPMAA